MRRPVGARRSVRRAGTISAITAAVIALMMVAASYAGTPALPSRVTATAHGATGQQSAAGAATLPTVTTTTLPAWSTPTTRPSGGDSAVETFAAEAPAGNAHVAAGPAGSRSRQPADAAATPSASPTGSTQPPSITTTSPGSGASPPCQGTTPLGLPGNWSCTFDDEFNGTSLNTNDWVPQVTASSGYVNGATACYQDNPQTISVSGGYLNLTALQVAPFTCPDGSNSFTTSYEAGMVSTDGLFDQTYGAFEVSAKLPPSVVEGLQETMWLYPQTLTYGPWPDSGEIDFAEFYSEFPGLDVPYIHYADSSTDPNATSYDCLINQDAFNTYGVDWTPTSITVLYNGQPCLVDTPSTGSEPFDQPFFIALTQALGVGTNPFTPGTTELPATTQIDWVRAWAPAS
jgi:beta-glucanase (GH16 family)